MRRGWKERALRLRWATSCHISLGGGGMVSTRLWVILVIFFLVQSAWADPIERRPFGETSDHKPVEQIILTNNLGASAKIITYGAIVTNLFVPDKNGKM